MLTASMIGRSNADDLLFYTDLGSWDLDPEDCEKCDSVERDVLEKLLSKTTMAPGKHLAEQDRLSVQYYTGKKRAELWQLHEAEDKLGAKTVVGRFECLCLFLLSLPLKGRRLLQRDTFWEYADKAAKMGVVAVKPLEKDNV